MRGQGEQFKGAKRGRSVFDLSAKVYLFLFGFPTSRFYLPDWSFSQMQCHFEIKKEEKTCILFPFRVFFPTFLCSIGYGQICNECWQWLNRFRLWDVFFFCCFLYIPEKAVDFLVLIEFHD